MAAQKEVTARAWVFLQDPISQTGEKAHDPAAAPELLDACRREVKLRLTPATRGKRQGLESAYVKLVVSPLRIEPPTEVSNGGTVTFDYRARTNEFAAVNAFYHCDRMFRQLKEKFGFDLDRCFRYAKLPIMVMHRGIIEGSCPNGECINAQVEVDKSNKRIEMRFALADLRNRRHPLGLATDARFVWHEFGHALLAAATGELELPFAHNIGDALAAINCDPDSKLATTEFRGETIPWITRDGRQHDREPDGFWQWNGGFYDIAHYPNARDPHGYLAEQLLSSTLFRLYRRIGGDALNGEQKPDVDTRRAAADYVTFLIAHAILVPEKIAQTPNEFAHHLISADADVEFKYKRQQYPAGKARGHIEAAFKDQGLKGPIGRA